MSQVTTEELSAYLDGFLADDEVARIEAALQADPALQVELDELRELVASLGALPEVEAPDSLLAGVLAQVADLPIPTGDVSLAGAGAGPEVFEAPANDGGKVVAFPWWIRGPAAAAVAALLLVGAGVWFVSQDAAGPPASSAMKPVAASSAPELAAPAPTGALDLEAVVADADVDIDDDIRARLRERAAREVAAETELLVEPTPEVRTGAAQPAPPRPAVAPAPQPRPAPEPEPEGVFVAEFERPALDGEPMHADHDEGLADHDEGLEVAAAEEMEETRSGRSLSLEEVSFGAARKQAPAAAASDADAADDAPAPRGLRASLVLRGERAALESALAARGFQVVAVGGGQLQITAPGARLPQLEVALRQHGTYSVADGSSRAVNRDGNVRMVLTLK